MNGSATKKRVLVINTAFLGDVALTTPLFSLLAENGWTVEALVVPNAAPLLADHPFLDRVIVYDKHREPGHGKLFSLGRELRGRYDAVIVPHRSARSALLAWLTHAPVRVGYRPPRRPYSPPYDNPQLRPHFAPVRFLYTERIDFVLGRHEALRVCDLARPLNLSPPEEPHGVLGVSERDIKWADAALKELKRPVTAIFPGSIWETKRYPPERYAAVAHGLIRHTGGSVVLLGTQADRIASEIILSNTPDGVHSLVGKTNLGKIKALITSVDLVLSNDSGPIYMTSALFTPVVCIFGPTGVPGGFWPFFVPYRIVTVKGLECRPCSLHGHRLCPLGHHRCMLDLAPELVVEACRDLLEEVGL